MEFTKKSKVVRLSVLHKTKVECLSLDLTLQTVLKQDLKIYFEQHRLTENY